MDPVVPHLSSRARSAVFRLGKIVLPGFAAKLANLGFTSSGCPDGATSRKLPQFPWSSIFTRLSHLKPQLQTSSPPLAVGAAIPRPSAPLALRNPRKKRLNKVMETRVSSEMNMEKLPDPAHHVLKARIAFPEALKARRLIGLAVDVPPQTGDEA